MLALYFISVSYFASAPHVFLSVSDSNSVAQVAIIYHAAICIAWLAVGAEFHCRVQQSTLEWIAKITSSKCNLSIQDQLVLNSLMNETYANPIAFSSKYFRITYGFLGHVRFIIICLQSILHFSCMDISYRMYNL